MTDDTSRTPNWQKWCLMPHAKLWELVALSLDIDPDSVSHHKQSWMHGTHLFEESRDFRDRIDIALANVQYFEVVALNMGDATASKYTVASFAAWAQSNALEIPKEMMRVAEKARLPSTKAVREGTRAEEDKVSEAVCGRLLVDFRRILEAEIKRRRTGRDEHGADAIDSALNRLNQLISQRVENADTLEFAPQPSDGAAPNPANRDHVSNQLAYVNQAAQKFWAYADRNDRTTHPPNEKIAAWLIQYGKFSSTLAKKAATIIRPDWAPTGRKPEE
jgi:hypothetical protein